MRYFFDIRDDQLVPDEEGMILPDIGAAQEEATRTLTDLVREAMRAESAGGMTIEVRSQHGPVLEASLTWPSIAQLGATDIKKRFTHGSKKFVTRCVEHKSDQSEARSERPIAACHAGASCSRFGSLVV
jgi:hypothetical protein